MSEDISELVQLRPADSSDTDFIVDSWLKHYREHCDGIKNTEYYEGHRKAIARLFDRRDTVLSVVCNKDNPGVILAWACFDWKTVHYLYVKAAFRRTGLASLVLKDANLGELKYSHKTPQGMRWLRRRDYEGRYDPYAFFMEE